MDQKSIFASRTVWFNILSLLVVVLSTIAGWDWVSTEYSAYLLSAVNVANIVLRVITGQPVAFFPCLPEDRDK